MVGGKGGGEFHGEEENMEIRFLDWTKHIV